MIENMNKNSISRTDREPTAGDTYSIVLRMLNSCGDLLKRRTKRNILRMRKMVAILDIDESRCAKAEIKTRVIVNTTTKRSKMFHTS